jgi:hypothetical protein
MWFSLNPNKEKEEEETQPTDSPATPLTKEEVPAFLASLTHIIY